MSMKYICAYDLDVCVLDMPEVEEIYSKWSDIVAQVRDIKYNMMN